MCSLAQTDEIMDPHGLGSGVYLGQFWNRSRSKVVKISHEGSGVSWKVAEGSGRIQKRMVGRSIMTLAPPPLDYGFHTIIP